MGVIRSSIAALAVGTLCTAAHAASLFIGGYPDVVLVFDEAKGAITDRITLVTGVPRSMALSSDKSKIFVTTGGAGSGFEVIDVATRKVLSHFSLDSPVRRYRINGGVPDPTGKFYYTTLIQIDKGIDRYTVSKPKYAVIDLEQQQVVRSRDVDDEDEQATATSFRTALAVSPDGKLLYAFRDKVVVLNTADLKVVERIDLAKSEADLETATFGAALESISQPGQFVSLFNETDPYIHNRLFGIGRFKLDTREFSFTPIGPAPATMAGLQVAPDGKTAYTVAVNGTFGNKRCEFWRFDLASNVLQAKAEFPCRTRFTLGISGDGQKLYIHGANYQIEVYDAQALKLERTWDLHNDVTGAMLTVGR